MRYALLLLLAMPLALSADEPPADMVLVPRAVIQQMVIQYNLAIDVIDEAAKENSALKGEIQYLKGIKCTSLHS